MNIPEDIARVHKTVRTILISSMPRAAHMSKEELEDWRQWMLANLLLPGERVVRAERDR